MKEFLEYWETQDPDAFYMFADYVKSSFVPPVDRNILSPLGDIRANKNFAGTPVVPQSMPDNPKYQYDERTSCYCESRRSSIKHITYADRSCT